MSSAKTISRRSLTSRCAHGNRSSNQYVVSRRRCHLRLKWDWRDGQPDAIRSAGRNDEREVLSRSRKVVRTVASRSPERIP